MFLPSCLAQRRKEIAQGHTALEALLAHLGLSPGVGILPAQHLICFLPGPPLPRTLSYLAGGSLSSWDPCIFRSQSHQRHSSGPQGHLHPRLFLVLQQNGWLFSHSLLTQMSHLSPCMKILETPGNGVPPGEAGSGMGHRRNHVDCSEKEWLGCGQRGRAGPTTHWSPLCS
jgi:hypothetical protein